MLNGYQDFTHKIILPMNCVLVTDKLDNIMVYRVHLTCEWPSNLLTCMLVRENSIGGNLIEEVWIKSPTFKLYFVRDIIFLKFVIVHSTVTVIQEVYLFYIKNLFILLSIYINNLMDFLYLMVPEMRQEKSNSNIWTFLFYIRLECNFCCKMIIFMIYWS
jgi:hypothetical protein